MGYTLTILPAAMRDMEDLPRRERERITARIDLLLRQPRPPGCVKLAGWRHRYRVRVGRCRVVYEVCDDALLVVVQMVDHRKSIYDRL